MFESVFNFFELQRLNVKLSDHQGGRN